MATYILLSNLTDEGAKTLMQNPARLQEVNKEIEKLEEANRTHPDALLLFMEAIAQPA